MKWMWVKCVYKYINKQTYVKNKCIYKCVNTKKNIQINE